MGVIADSVSQEFGYVAPVSIVKFAEEMCGYDLFPRQKVLLKLIWLEEMDEYEESVLDEWIAGKNGVEISPKIRERRQYLRDRGYPHFTETILIGGRRASKGFVTGISGAKKIRDIQALGDPGKVYQIPVTKEIYFSTVAASLKQSKELQFADLSNTVTACSELREFLFAVNEEGFRVKTDADINYQKALQADGVKGSRDFSKLRAQPLAANAGTIRGATSIFIAMDEMAHMMTGENKATAEACYDAAQPSLRQFGKDAMMFLNSSPWSKIGKFYERSQDAYALDDDGSPAHPNIFAIKYPSWEMYRDYSRNPKLSFPLMVDPDTPDEEIVSEDERDRRDAARLDEKANPQSFAVEYRAEWADVQDAYFDPFAVDRAFSGFIKYKDQEGKEHVVPVQPHESGTYQAAYIGHCFAGETKFLTDKGSRRLDEMVGQEDVKVLWNKGWQPAEIKSFGVQKLLTVHLTRKGKKKTIRATPDHIWFTCYKNYTQRGKRNPKKDKRTVDLMPGDILPVSKRTKYVTFMSPFGIARGFVFGDGTGENRLGNRAYLHGHKDAPMRRYFEGHIESQGTWGEEGDDERTRAIFHHMPAYFKRDFPDLQEDPSYLYGWLAGYFAADGSVSENGRASITSGSVKNIEYVRDLCNQLGIMTYGIIEWTNTTGYTPGSKGYKVYLRRADLDPDFFLIEEHRKRFEANPPSKFAARGNWRVEKVVDDNEEEEVYCAVVPRGHAFTLEDNILVHNCDPSSTTAGFGFALGHVEQYPDAHFKGQLVDHVIFDIVKRWDPAEFPGHTIRYESVIEDLVHYCKIFRPHSLTHDQYMGTLFGQNLRKALREANIHDVRVAESTGQEKKNWDEWELLKSALNLDLVHVHPELGDAQWARKELRFLKEVRPGKVDKQTSGPVVTKDVSDAIRSSTFALIGQKLASLLGKDTFTPGLRKGSEGGYQIGGRNTGGPVGPMGGLSSIDSFYGNRQNSPTHRGMSGRKRR